MKKPPMTIVAGGAGLSLGVLGILGMMFALGVGASAQGLPPAQLNRPIPVTLPPAPGAQSALAGGVAPHPATAPAANTVLALSLDEAIQRGLRDNLAPILASSQTEQARAQKIAALAALLPRVDASAGEQRQKVNLAAFGFSFPNSPSIIGPFNVFQASAAASIPLLNLSALDNARAAGQLQDASIASYQATRNLVVLAVANQYLLTVADASRVEAAQAELNTAQSALEQARDMLSAGTVNALAAVRAQVQRDRQQQQLTAATNALAKQRLTLARAIGLPMTQRFRLTSEATFEPLPVPNANTAVAEALTTRPDYHAARRNERAAQLLVSGAKAERLPTVALIGNYGTIGHELDSNHPIFSVGANIEVPLFAGGAMRADRIRAEAQLRDTRSRLADLRSQIDVEVRSALLDLDSNQAQVEVARDARSLANRELQLAQDRFRAGVADNLEVVQAQQSVADADESFISSLYQYNVAKAQLAQALGVAATNYQHFLPSK